MRELAKRSEIAFCEGVDGEAIAIGDRVAVAVAQPSRALRIGEVLEITGCFYDSKWRDIRVKIKYILPRHKYNPSTGQFEDAYRTASFDDVTYRVVKVA